MLAFVATIRRRHDVFSTTRAGAAAFAVLLAALSVFQPLSANALEIEEVTSDGGVTAWLVEDHNNPVISVRIAFEGGAALDPKDKAGLASMVAALLDEGAGDMDSQSFRAALEERSIKLSFGAGEDVVYGTLQTLTENRRKAFELLGLAVSQPRFDEEPISRIRSQILSGLASDLADPGTIAWRAFNRIAFPDHPYGVPSDGNPATIKAIKRDDLISFANNRLARDRLVVGVAGDITAEELKSLLDIGFGNLPEKASPFAIPEAEARGAGETAVIEMDIPQSRAVFGHNGVKREHPDYYAASIVNYILGGGSFASRLFEEVREKRGLAYGVYTYLRTLDHTGMVMGSVGTANARIGEALDVIRVEWRRLAENGPTDEEVADAKTYLTGSFPISLTSTSSIASLLVGVQVEELGIDYINRRNDLIEAVTVEDARRVAAELLQADNLTVVVVGKPDGVEPTVQAPAAEGKGS
jgi:zinc protease